MASDVDVNELLKEWLERLQKEFLNVADCARKAQDKANKNETNIAWLTKIVIAIFVAMVGLAFWIIKKGV